MTVLVPSHENFMSIKSFVTENSVHTSLYWIPYLLSFKALIMHAASAGETCDAELGLSVGLWAPKLPEELGLGVAGREDPGELLADGAYHGLLLPSCGRC